MKKLHIVHLNYVKKYYLTTIGEGEMELNTTLPSVVVSIKKKKKKRLKYYLK